MDSSPRCSSRSQATKPLVRNDAAATGKRPARASTGFARVRAVIASLLKGFPIATIVFRRRVRRHRPCGRRDRRHERRGSAALLVVCVGLLAVVGAAAAITLRLDDLCKMTVAVPDNLFGICRGLGADDANPGFTDWLSAGSTASPG